MGEHTLTFVVEGSLSELDELEAVWQGVDSLTRSLLAVSGVRGVQHSLVVPEAAGQPSLIEHD